MRLGVQPHAEALASAPAQSEAMRINLLSQGSESTPEEEAWIRKPKSGALQLRSRQQLV